MVCGPLRVRQLGPPERQQRAAGGNAAALPGAQREAGPVPAALVPAVPGPGALGQSSKLLKNAAKPPKEH